MLMMSLLLLGPGGGGGVRGGGGGGGRGRGRGRGGRDNQLLGKTIRITRGPYKGTILPVYIVVHGEVSYTCTMTESLNLHTNTYICHTSNYWNSARNKNQYLIGHFFEDSIFYGLLTAVLLKM